MIIIRYRFVQANVVLTNDIPPLHDLLVTILVVLVVVAVAMTVGAFCIRTKLARNEKDDMEDAGNDLPPRYSDLRQVDILRPPRYDDIVSDGKPPSYPVNNATNERDPPAYDGMGIQE